MFWKNIKDLLANSPLILSDTYDPQDISMNRVITLLLVINVILLAWYMVAHLETVDKIVVIWDKLLTLLGVQAGGVNMVKRGIDCYKQVKCNKLAEVVTANKADSHSEAT